MRRSPRSCATCVTSPTGSTCGATSTSARAFARPGGTKRRAAGSFAPTAAIPSGRAFASCPVGCLSEPKAPDFEGIERFSGELLYTARWPHEPPDLHGKRVGIIGTGSSGVQCIPIIAEQAAELTVFMRTPSFALPAHNRRLDEAETLALKAGFPEHRRLIRQSSGGVLAAMPEVTTLEVSAAERGQSWTERQVTYLGVAIADFPNLFTITGPGSPSVLSNMVASIEQHVEWAVECINQVREQPESRIEATAEAQEKWTEHVAEVAAFTVYPKADSWYMGANIAGKPRRFLPYIAGLNDFREICKRRRRGGLPGLRRELNPSSAPQDGRRSGRPFSEATLAAGRL